MELLQGLWKHFVKDLNTYVGTPFESDHKVLEFNIKDRIKKHLPNSETFPLWDKTYIPNVENAISEISKTYIMGTMAK